jgi:protein SCO1/2
VTWLWAKYGHRLAWGSVTAALTAAVLLVGCQPAQPPLDDFGRSPDFALTDQSGATFASSALTGRVTLLDFIYTRCTDACPLLSASFQQAQRKLSDEKLLGSKVMLVSVSVDPVHDTPPVMAEYSQQFKADPEGWKLLTGDWEQVWDVITAYKVATRPARPAPDTPAPGGTELTHTTRVVLIDQQQQVRAYLEGQDATGDDLVRAARRLVK